VTYRKFGGRGRPRINLDDPFSKVLGDWLSQRYSSAEDKRQEAFSLDPSDRERVARSREALELYTAKAQDMIAELGRLGLGGKSSSRDSTNRRIRVWEQAGVLRRKVWEKPPLRKQHRLLFMGRLPRSRPRKRLRRRAGKYTLERIPARDHPKVRAAKLTTKGISVRLDGWPVRGEWWIVADANQIVAAESARPKVNGREAPRKS